MEQDTSPAQLRIYHDKLRAMSPADRLRAAAKLSLGVRRLAEAGVRQRFPAVTDEEVFARLMVRLYGRATSSQIVTVPDDAV